VTVALTVETARPRKSLQKGTAASLSEPRRAIRGSSGEQAGAHRAAAPEKKAATCSRSTRLVVAENMLNE